KTYIGSLTTDTTATDGNVSFTFHPATLNAGDIITATTTDDSGNTSEFSQCVTAQGGSAGFIAFTSPSSSVPENVAGGMAAIIVSRSGGTAGSITATFSTSDGSATAGSDYTAITGQTINYADGESGPKTVMVQIIDDSLYEGNESLNLNLSATTVNRPGGIAAPSGGPSTSATLVITDNEPKPSLNINDVFIAEPSTSTTNATFTVTLSNAAQDPVTVHYQTMDGTAHAPADYDAIADSVLTFNSGQLTKTVNVTVKADALTENAETFTVDLSNVSSNATIGNTQGTGTITDPTLAGQLLVSEFRLRGSNGSADEFIELYNNTNNSITVATSDGSAGWAVVASDTPTVPRFVVPAGTVIPARGHYLGANLPAVGNPGPAPGNYSLSAYAVDDDHFTQDIPDGAGLAVFSTANAPSFDTAHRLDAVGFAGVTDTLFREGAGLQPAPGITNDAEFSFVRNLATGIAQDTDDNAQDFVLVAPDPALITGATAQLGAPGPEDCGCNPEYPFAAASPTQRNATIKASLIEPQQTSTAPPNRVRDLTPVANGAQGTLSLRRRFTNTTGQTITRLRFRIVDVTTLNTPNPGGAQADVRLLDSPTFSITTSRGPLTVHGTFIETPPAQTNGGGLNTSAGIVGLPVGLVPGSSIDVQFLLGVQTNGRFRFLVNVEALP
ncbi:MAG: Calx-beta domain-containing protein, partial [Pyrinomonadaceae bacterium]